MNLFKYDFTENVLLIQNNYRPLYKRPEEGYFKGSKCNNFMIEHRLKYVIKSKGVKVSYLADKLEIPQPTLSLYLNGKRRMPAEVEFKLAKELA